MKRDTPTKKKASALLDREARTSLSTYEDLYAGIERDGEAAVVYIGGRYYGGSAQIHLSITEAKQLRSWLNRRFPKARERT